MKIFLYIITLAFVCLLKSPVIGQTHYRYVLTHNESLKNNNKKIKHIHDSESPDPQEEARELKKRQRRARNEREEEILNKDKENIDYEKRRWRSDNSAKAGSYAAISKAGLKQHRRKLKEDKGRI